MSKRPPFLQSLNLDSTHLRIGTVYLVGAGPGDPELLTLRAARLLGCADTVVYDNLVGEGILDLAHPDAERIYVGKQKDNHTLPQHEINMLLVRLAKQGKQVVRLKGGDPFIFGRGGEELEVLVQHEIHYEVVPGITAANGVSCYTGIPLTHRDYAQSCVFTTGHLKDGSLNLDWENLAHPRQTVVIYMGLGALPEISSKLVEYGRDANTPVAVVEQGTTLHQRVATGTLQTIAERVADKKFKSPCLIIVGEVAALHDKLRWFAGEMLQPAQVAVC